MISTLLLLRLSVSLSCTLFAFSTYQSFMPPFNSFLISALVSLSFLPSRNFLARNISPCCLLNFLSFWKIQKLLRPTIVHKTASSWSCLMIIYYIFTRLLAHFLSIFSYSYAEAAIFLFFFWSKKKVYSESWLSIKVKWASGSYDGGKGISG